LLIDSHMPPPFFFDVARGQVWRLLTPIFLHGNMLHLLFNAYMLFLFGSTMEQLRGSGRFLAFALAAALISNVAQYVFTASPGFGGMSGVNYALFGYIWMKSRYEPESGFYIDPTTVMILVVWFFLGVANVIGNIANVAHAGGLVVGLVVGYAPKFWRDLNRS
jgi:GlpG protein